jgi:FKBP-type peptidyl-prolyl cis-trans isomerase
MVALAGCRTTRAGEPEEEVLEQYTDELQVEQLRAGTGEVARSGMHVTVHYKGMFLDGSVFDSSLEREPLVFELGARRVIKGWDQGVLGMKVGEKRRLIVPPRLAYGHRGFGAVIPPDTRLVFEVELLRVTP